MKTEKIKRYRLGISRTFLSDHPRAGKKTYFVEKIQLALCGVKGPLMMYAHDMEIVTELKLHTIRANYPEWVKRIAKVHAGKAVIDLCYWKLPGGRFTKGNELIPFATLDKDSGCGVQKLEFQGNDFNYPSVCHTRNPLNHMFKPLQRDLAKNDGLSLEDFKAWFKGYDMSKPMAIIHFTKFRY